MQELKVDPIQLLHENRPAPSSTDWDKLEADLEADVTKQTTDELALEFPSLTTDEIINLSIISNHAKRFGTDSEKLLVELLEKTLQQNHSIRERLSLIIKTTVIKQARTHLKNQIVSDSFKAWKWDSFAGCPAYGGARP